MSDYKLSFVPDLSYVNRLLEARGVTEPSVTFYPQSNIPTGTSIGDSDQVFSIYLNESGNQRRLQFFLQDPQNSVQEKSIRIGKREEVARVEFFQFDANRDGAIDVLAIAVDAHNNFLTGAIAYSSGSKLPTFGPFKSEI